MRPHAIVPRSLNWIHDWCCASQVDGFADDKVFRCARGIRLEDKFANVGIVAEPRGDAVFVADDFFLCCASMSALATNSQATLFYLLGNIVELTSPVVEGPGTPSSFSSNHSKTTKLTVLGSEPSRVELSNLMRMYGSTEPPQAFLPYMPLHCCCLEGSCVYSDSMSAMVLGIPAKVSAPIRFLRR